MLLLLLLLLRVFCGGLVGGAGNRDFLDINHLRLAPTGPDYVERVELRSCDAGTTVGTRIVRISARLLLGKRGRARLA